jgi:hypothetical protein
MRRTIGRLSLLTAVLATLACAEIFGPSIALDTYRLTSVNGNPVPYVTYDTTLDDGSYHEFRIASDSIVFGWGDRLWGNRVYRERSYDRIVYRPDSTRDSLPSSVEGTTGSFRGLSSDKVVITYDNFGLFPFPWPPDTLIVDGDRLRRYATYYYPTPQVWTFIYTRTSR